MKKKKRCDFCHKESIGETTIDDRWTFRNCGSFECKRKQTLVIKLLMGDLSNITAIAMARVIPDKEMYHDLVKWKDYGESSLTLFAVYCEIEKASPATPYDPSDFRRCVHLFECLNLNKEDISNLLLSVAEKYPDWKPFADNWTTLTELYEEEKEQKTAPKLYEFMKKVRKESGLSL